MPIQRMADMRVLRKALASGRRDRRILGAAAVTSMRSRDQAREGLGFLKTAKTT